jgi:hypothetical protein
VIRPLLSALLLSALVAAPAFAARAQEPAAPETEQPVRIAPVQAEEPPQVEPAQQAPDAERERRLEANRARFPTLFEGALLDANDGEDFAETPGYRRLVELVSAYTPDEVAQRARTDFDYAEFLAEPDLWRGEFVRIRSVLVTAQASRLVRPLGEHEDVWRGFIAEADGSEGIAFDMLERPPDGLEDRRTVVDLEGLVYRVVRYENRDGKLKDAPFLIARSLKAVDLESTPKRGVAEPFMLMLVALAVLFLVGRILLAMRRRNSPHREYAGRTPSFHEMFERANERSRRAPKDGGAQ